MLQRATEMYGVFCTTAARTEKKGKTYTISARKPKGKRPLSRHRRIRKDNIKTSLKETDCKDVD